MAVESAGLLMYRRKGGAIEIFLVHPGGPFFAGKDLGAWSIPKGLIHENEDALEAAKREFQEETGFHAEGRFIPLSAVKLKSGKVVRAWAVEGDHDPVEIKSNLFSMEWPPHSGEQREFPEVDRAAWFDVEAAKMKINQGQRPLIEELSRIEGDAL
jgi:predicted NUDIX family NTP pyrophosphohydrolase